MNCSLFPEELCYGEEGTEKLLLKIFSYDTRFSVRQNIRLLANETIEVMRIKSLPSEGLTLCKAQELSSPASLEGHLELISCHLREVLLWGSRD